MRWDIVTFSLGNGIDPKSIDSDVRHFRNANFPDAQEILVVNDASEDVGSGGSALNALIRTAERLCYRKNYTVLTEVVLQNVNVLIVLVSDPRAILNSENTTNGGNSYIFDTYLSNAIKNAGLIAERARQKGVWVIGSDTFWKVEKQPDMFDLPGDSITGFSCHVEKTELNEHGRYRANSENQLIGMEFDGESCGSESPGNDNNLILGFIYLPVHVATSFLSLYSEYPVAASTYLGVDSNVTPLKLSIFFDFMLATCTSKPDFVGNKLGGHGKVSENVKDRSNARKQIYRKLKGFKGRVELLSISNFQYRKFPTTPRSFAALLEDLYVALPTDPDVERVLRSILSILSIDRSDSSISKILDLLHEQILTSVSSDSHLQTIFTTSLALSLASNGKGGLRNGPAKNPVFESLLKDKRNCLDSIFKEIKTNWVADPSKMIRAARHLETVAQKLIHEMVDDCCAVKTVTLSKLESPGPSSVKVTAPVRIDFFGGWLDTPPIFFGMKEGSAAVVNMAIQLDGKDIMSTLLVDHYSRSVIGIDILVNVMNPISCHITKTTAPSIELIQDGTSIHIESDEDLIHMHDKPSETGALVSACIVALGFRKLSDFFETLQCTGLRIETMSDLPHGSGLGTSSSLAGTILRAICAFGKVPEDRFSVHDQVVNTVLRVEQIMTTGGGWQDQFGAMYPGLKKCYYLEGEGIVPEPINLSAEVKNLLEERLLLVYTGKTRLAKNLLQEVIRNYFTCVDTKNQLRAMSDAVDEFSRRIGEDLSVKLLEQYHEIKKFMTRCEPPIVTELLEELKSASLISVGWAAGAGGGGFLYLWLTEHTSPSIVESFLSSHPNFCQMTCHRISIPLTSPVTMELN